MNIKIKYFCGISCGDVPVLKNFRTTWFEAGEGISDIKRRLLPLIPETVRGKADACISNQDATFLNRSGLFVFAWEAKEFTSFRI